MRCLKAITFCFISFALNCYFVSYSAAKNGQRFGLKRNEDQGHLDVNSLVVSKKIIKILIQTGPK